MGRKYTKVLTDAPKQLVLGAGVLAKNFDPVSGTLNNSDILFATTGGFNFSDTPVFRDNGADIDNCPKNTKELMEIESREMKLTGNAVTATPATAKMLMVAADTGDNGVITPRDLLKDTDFTDLWLIADYGATDGGLMAIKLMNALNTDGLNIQTVDREKGKYAFGFTAHYSLKAQDTVPYEVYLQSKDAA